MRQKDINDVYAAKIQPKQNSSRYIHLHFFNLANFIIFLTLYLHGKLVGSDNACDNDHVGHDCNHKTKQCHAD